ncbi:MAG: hypothetical protein AAB339_02245, partial [Elusimicrobiota bacterium]
SAYGAHPDNPVPLTEESPLRPNMRFQYSRDKAETDRMFQDYAATGLSLKALQETLYDRKATAFAADAGVRFRHQDVDDFALSFVLRNFGTRPRFINARESLPVEADIGASYDLQGDKRRLLAVLEAALPYYGAPFGKLGLEYSFRVGESASMSLRTGYKTLSAPYLGFASGITAGVGLLTGKVTADFSFQPIGTLGEAYRFSLGLRF